jgi:UDP-N-acetylglucosamine 2-epimerase (non-hydrolysing)
MRASHILTILGTRPEAIKLAPVLERLGSLGGIASAVCATGQHRELLAPMLALFDIRPDYNLQLMTRNQTLSEITASLMGGLAGVIADFKPDRVIVQGDTTTALCGALSAYYARVPVAHVEAGLRTGNIDAPWPEEANRKMIASLADLHFAPTMAASDNLIAEGVAPDTIHVTGNTSIDALFAMGQRLKTDVALRQDCARAFDFLDARKRLVLVTIHRRESQGAAQAGIFRALARLARRPDMQIVYPLHLNPKVREPAIAALGGRDNVFLLDPLPYHRFVHLLGRATLVVTDSGGIQEEAPALGRPVLVARDVTERLEAVGTGSARLIGSDGEQLIEAASSLLGNAEA